MRQAEETSSAMWRIYSIGFGVMSVVMVPLGLILFVVTLLNPAAGGTTPEWVWLVRALVAVIMGAIAATLSVSAWRQAQRMRL